MIFLFNQVMNTHPMRTHGGFNPLLVENRALKPYSVVLPSTISPTSYGFTFYSSISWGAIENETVIWLNNNNEREVTDTRNDLLRLLHLKSLDKQEDF